MGGSIAVLALIPFINSSETRNTTYRPIFKIFYWMLVSDFFLLMW
jgi:ubiquinol-cytochrome c reductase cytochrome b subunit